VRPSLSLRERAGVRASLYRTPPERRPRDLDGVDALLRLGMEEAVASAVPIEVNPWITAV
jgi:hypothetical protein